MCACKTATPAALEDRVCVSGGTPTIAVDSTPAVGTVLLLGAKFVVRSLGRVQMLKKELSRV